MQKLSNINDLSQEIFTKHSITYSLAAKLFPKPIQRDVALLYAFVRIADEFVDNPTADPAKQLATWRAGFETAWSSDISHLIPGTFEGEFAIIPHFCTMAQKYGFEKHWIDAFFDSMEEDIFPVRYATWEELMRYVFGSAEVIGLMMTRLMGTLPQYDAGARALGASMQLINFARDFHEDHARDRLYIPESMLSQHGLTEETLWADGANTSKEHLIKDYIERIDVLQKEAEASFTALPEGCLLPVQLASDAYKHTLNKIRKDPLLAFRGAPKNRASDMLVVATRTLFSHSLHAVQRKISV